MKAVQISRFGGSEVLELVDMPTPVLGKGQLLVRVHAIGVNLADTLTRMNRYAVTPPLPAILGAEAAGVIEELGAETDGFTKGQRVVACLFAGNSIGAYAELVVIDASLAIPVPDAISFDQAAALLVQGLTALYLTRQAPPREKTVLVNAAAGGVGSLLVQLCNSAGATTVIAGASTRSKLEFACALGADAGVNYSEPDWVEKLQGLTGGKGSDIIYESVGHEVTKASFAALAPLGQIVIYGALNIQSFDLGVPELLRMIFKNQSLTGFAFTPLLSPNALRADCADLFARVVKGDLTVTIGGRYPLAEAAKAHAALEGRGTMGKLILTC